MKVWFSLLFLLLGTAYMLEPAWGKDFKEELAYERSQYRIKRMTVLFDLYEEERQQAIREPQQQENSYKGNPEAYSEQVIEAFVTAYNTVEWQTDDSPCYAGGEYICGRDDVVACPTWIPKGTVVEIKGKEYVCLDRMASRFQNKPKFDISFDKDIGAAKNWGIQKLEVIVYVEE